MSVIRKGKKRGQFSRSSKELSTVVRARVFRQGVQSRIKSITVPGEVLGDDEFNKTIIIII